LSTGGLFVETAEARDVDATIWLDFLVQRDKSEPKPLSDM